MTNIFVDKSTDNIEPLLIRFCTTIFNAKESFYFQRETKEKASAAYNFSRNMIGLFPKMGIPDWPLHCVTN